MAVPLSMKSSHSRRIASQGQTIQLYDGTTPVGPVVLVRADGEWEQTLRNLAEGAHSFTAKALYGAGGASASWKVTVVAVETPKITSAKDGHNNTIDEEQEPRWI